MCLAALPRANFRFRYIAVDIAVSISSGYSFVLYQSDNDGSFAGAGIYILIRALTAHITVRGGRRTLFAIAAGLALSSLCGTAAAATGAADGNEKECPTVGEDNVEVVCVTARRRTERAQEVPSR